MLFETRPGRSLTTETIQNLVLVSLLYPQMFIDYFEGGRLFNDACSIETV
jgi:hypothetical protein